MADITATWVDSFSHFLSNNRNASNEQIMIAFLEARCGCNVNRDAVRGLLDFSRANPLDVDSMPQSDKMGT